MSEKLEEAVGGKLLRHHLKKEELKIYSYTLSGNSCKAEVRATLELSDGSVWETSKEIKVKFKKVKK